MKKAPLILFVHGLSGSADGTWSVMDRVAASCTAISQVERAFFQYPTQIIRRPFGQRMPKIQHIAEGLKGFIETHGFADRNIILVAHSLGGIIARTYILEQRKSSLPCPVVGLILYASPLEGSVLANIGSRFSWRHAHLSQLRTDTDFLDGLNRDWVSMKIESSLAVLSVIGGVDAVVPYRSASPYIGASNIRVLIEYGHIDITKPQSVDDPRFLTLKRFVTDHVHSAAPAVTKAGDVLFEAYSLNVEQFYVKRRSDTVLEESAKSRNLWVCGQPGVGKTAAIRRFLEMNEWRFLHVILDGYIGLSPVRLIIEICNRLYEFSDSDVVVPQSCSVEGLFKHFRAAMKGIPVQDKFAILVEEIPLPPGEDLKEFVSLVYSITQQFESSSEARSVALLFTSLHFPKKDFEITNPKVYEKIHFIEFAAWNDAELDMLWELLVNQLDISIVQDDRGEVFRRSKGSPRFMKIFFQRKRSEIGSRIPTAELLASIEKDLGYE